MKNSKNDRTARDNQLSEGLNKHTSKGTYWVIGQKKYPQATILDLLARRMASAQAIANAKAVWLAKRQEDEALEAETAKVLASVRQSLLVTYDGSPDVLADFGLSPRKEPRALTGGEIVLKATRAKATREARHTLGKRERRAIKGVVADLGPPNAPPPAPPAGPAPVASGPPPTATNGAANGAPVS